MKKMKKYIVIILVVILLAGVGYVVYYLYYNTAFLKVTDQGREIQKNNQNILPQEPDIGDDKLSDEIDLNNLIEQDLSAAEKFRTGVFSKLRKLNLPQDFSINVFMAGLDEPRLMSFDNDNNLFVADKGRGSIYLLKDNDRDGVAEEQIEIDTGLRVMHGVYYHNGDLYAAEENQVLKYNNINNQGEYSGKEVLINNLPAGSGHSTRTVIVGPDEKLYVSIGSSCNLCEEKDERRAAVVRYNLDGTGQEIFARGLRNSVGIQFYQGKLWSVNNGRDMIGDDLPPEEVNIIEQGKHYGWPYCYGRGIANPEYPDRASFCQQETQYPAYEMQAHSAPLGLDFMPEQDNSFPDLLKDNMFIGFHGSWNRTAPTGYKVVRLDVSREDSQTVNFVTGWLESDGSAWGRPVDVEFDNGGAMFISDDRAGAIYRVVYNKN